MSGLGSILLAIELATLKRDAHAKAVGKAQRSLGFARDQMAQLQGYASDTDARWAGTASSGVSVELMRHHYQFMARLQQAVSMQGGVLVQMEAQVEAARKTLLQAEVRLAGLKQFLENKKGAQQAKLARHEQRQSDEFAAMLHTRARARFTSGETI